MLKLKLLLLLLLLLFVVIIIVVDVDLMLLLYYVVLFFVFVLFLCFCYFGWVYGRRSFCIERDPRGYLEREKCVNICFLWGFRYCGKVIIYMYPIYFWSL